jgi:hypothetical protein
MVRRLKQEVARIIEGECPALTKLDAEIRGYMHICSGDQRDWYPGLGNPLL